MHRIPRPPFWLYGGALCAALAMIVLGSLRACGLDDALYFNGVGEFMMIALCTGLFAGGRDGRTGAVVLGPTLAGVLAIVEARGTVTLVAHGVVTGPQSFLLPVMTVLGARCLLGGRVRFPGSMLVVGAVGCADALGRWMWLEVSGAVEIERLAVLAYVPGCTAVLAAGHYARRKAARVDSPASFTLAEAASRATREIGAWTLLIGTCALAPALLADPDTKPVLTLGPSLMRSKVRGAFTALTGGPCTEVPWDVRREGAILLFQAGDHSVGVALVGVGLGRRTADTLARLGWHGGPCIHGEGACHAMLFYNAVRFDEIDMGSLLGGHELLWGSPGRPDQFRLELAAWGTEAFLKSEFKAASPRLEEAMRVRLDAIRRDGCWSLRRR